MVTNTNLMAIKLVDEINRIRTGEAPLTLKAIHSNDVTLRLAISVYIRSIDNSKITFFPS